MISSAWFTGDDGPALPARAPDPDQANHATLMSGAERERARERAARITHALSTAGFHNAALAVITATRETRTVDAVREAAQKNCSRDVLSSLSESMRGEIGVPRDDRAVVVPSPKPQDYTCDRCGVDGPMVDGLVGGVYCLNATACLARPASDNADPTARHGGQPVVAAPLPEMAVTAGASEPAYCACARPQYPSADHEAPYLCLLCGGLLPLAPNGDSAPSQSEVALLTERCERLTAERDAAVARANTLDVAWERMRATLADEMDTIAPLTVYLSALPETTAGEHAATCALRLLKMRAEQDRIDRGVIENLKSTVARQDALLDARDSEIRRLTERVGVARIERVDRDAEIAALKARAEQAEKSSDVYETWLGKQIDHSEAYETFVESLAARLGCEEEWSNLHDHRNCVLGAVGRIESEIERLKQERDTYCAVSRQLTAERDNYRALYVDEHGLRKSESAAASQERRTSDADLIAALVAVSDWRELSECWKQAAHGLAAESDEHEQRALRAEHLAAVRRGDCDALSWQLAAIAGEVDTIGRPFDGVHALVDAVEAWKDAELHYRFVSDMPDPGGSGADAFDRLTRARKALLAVGEAVGGFKGILHGVSHGASK